MRRPSLAALGIALALLAGPATTAQEAPAPAEDAASRPTSFVTFYGHVFGHGLDLPMPANTQYPHGEENYGIGGAGDCTGMIDDEQEVPVGGSCETQAGSKLVLYSTAGFVQVHGMADFYAQGAYSALHNEHGSTKDVVLDTTQPVTASVYLSWDAFGVPVGTGETNCIYPNPRDTGCLYPYWGWDPGAFPDVVVKAQIYYAVLGEYGQSASEQPQIRTALESGQATLVAEGRSHTPIVVNGLPGNPNVNEFVIDLGTPQVDRIPKEANFFIVYSFYHETSGQPWSTGEFRIWSGEFFPARFTLPVKNAFDVEQVVPQFIHDRLAILATINTPWGSYDVNPKATKLTITDERGSSIEPSRVEALADYRVAHGAHYKPVNVTFIWDYLADKLPAGAYKVTVEGANHQGSARAACTAEFVIGAGGAPERATPGLCGAQTENRFLNQTGVEGGPDASPGSVPPSLAGTLARLAAAPFE